MRTRVAVIGGGQNCEHDVSLASAAAIARALDPSYDVLALTIGRDGTWSDGDRAGAQQVDGRGQVEVAVPALHGPRGEDGTVAALCDLAGVPYVGSGVTAGALAMDKWATKLVAREIGIGVAPGVLLTAATAPAYTWRRSVVVKPVAAGSSHGVTLVREPWHLARALDEALSLDDRVLVEEPVVGREVDVAVLGRPDGTRVVAPVLEVVVDGIFDFGTKYGGAADFRIPAQLPEAVRQDLEVAAIAMYDALGCAGVARVDFFVTDDGLVLNEVNTMPGFTEQSQVPKMFAAAGTSYADLLDLLVRDALSGAVVAA